MMARGCCIVAAIIMNRAELDFASDGASLYNALNKTRQGYARKRILKPAGYFFLGPIL